MVPDSTRREYLAAVGGVAALGAVNRVGAASIRGPCEDARSLERDLETERETLAEKRDALAASKDRLNDLRLRVMELHAEAYPPEYDASTRQAALDLGKRMRESVVLQEFRYEHGGSTSTGWFVDEHHVVTNAHNVQQAGTEAVGQTLHGDTFEFEVLGYDHDLQPDVALLRTDYSGTPLPTGDSTALSKDDPLVMVGHPGGFGYWVVTLGPFVRRSTNFEGTEKLDTRIPAISGSSGSPVATLDGEVVGMINATTSADAGSGGAPQPAPPDVHYRLLAPDVIAELVPVESALDRTEDWR